IFVQRPAGAAGDQLSDGRELAVTRGRFQVRPRLAMCQTVPAPALGEQDVTLPTQRGQLLLHRSHSLSHLGDAALELGVVDRSDVVGHARTLPALVACAPVAISEEQAEV